MDDFEKKDLPAASRLQRLPESKSTDNVMSGETGSEQPFLERMAAFGLVPYLTPSVLLL
jgi:hypothetical protein